MRPHGVVVLTPPLDEHLRFFQCVEDLVVGQLAPATVRRKLSAVSSLYDYPCNENAVESNPVAGVKRPTKGGGNEGKTPALSDEQARMLPKAPDGDSLKARRDRATQRSICTTRCDAPRSQTCGSSTCGSGAG